MGCAFYDAECGILKIEYTSTAVTGIKCVRAAAEQARRTALSDRVFDQIRAYLDGKRRVFDFPFELRGTEFQLAVWNALLGIPYGETRTYKEIAAAVGRPSACRAEGMANRRNPLWIVVPCHRVIGANGMLTGYAGGLDMKRALLELERRNSE